MFTGLVEEIGSIAELHFNDGSVDIHVNCIEILSDLQIGDSIAVNGVCLTATRFNSAGFFATATPETLSKTNLGGLIKGARLNLERSLTLQSRLGGHMVQGHIDGTAKVVSIQQEDESQIWYFEVQPDIAKYLISKGSIAVNGVSLTVASILSNQFSVALIPTTIEMTTFKFLESGENVNIEVDMIGKYIYRFMEQAQIIV